MHKLFKDYITYFQCTLLEANQRITEYSELKEMLEDVTSALK